VTASDLIQSSRVRRTADGWEAIRVFMVDDATGTGNFLYDAATATGIPAYGAAHPTIAGIKVVEIDAAPVSTDSTAAVVTVSYRKPLPFQQPDPADDNETPTRSIAATVVEEIANKDSTGTIVTVTDGVDVQVAQFSLQKPTTALVFERRELNIPKTRASSYVGFLNSSTFDGFPAGTLLMTGISAVTRDNGGSYDVRYEMLYRPDGWEVTVYYRLDNGLPADGLTAPDGIKDVTVYGTANFSSLNLV
jgi:hypothetical protein